MAVDLHGRGRWQRHGVKGCFAWRGARGCSPADRTSPFQIISPSDGEIPMLEMRLFCMFVSVLGNRSKQVTAFSKWMDIFVSVA